jgi:hypothetical protein
LRPCPIAALLKVGAEFVDLRRAGVLDVTPHQPIEVGVPDPSLATDDGAIARGESLDDLLRIHDAQYTYPSANYKTHMYIVSAQNLLMVERQVRQTLARNVADRMHRDPALDTQKKLSGKSGVAQPHISRILRCTTGATIDAVGGLARAFGCQPWELLVDTELTRQAALKRMIIGTAAPDERVAEMLGVAPKAPRRRKV